MVPPGRPTPTMCIPRHRFRMVRCRTSSTSPTRATDEARAQLPAIGSEPMTSAHFGRYPWPQFSFVQGGDGGIMEYPMLTLINDGGRLGSLVGERARKACIAGTGVLASNEGNIPGWMKA